MVRLTNNVGSTWIMVLPSKGTVKFNNRKSIDFRDIPPVDYPTLANYANAGKLAVFTDSNIKFNELSKYMKVQMI